MELVLSFWTFIAASLIMAVMGQVMKGAVFTKDAINKARLLNKPLSSLLWFARKTLPVHPVLVGVLLGLTDLPIADPLDPDGSASTAVRMLYYGFAGVTSTWAFSVLKSVMKRQNIELELPGEK